MFTGPQERAGAGASPAAIGSGATMLLSSWEPLSENPRYVAFYEAAR